MVFRNPLKMVYALVGTRMNLMLDLKRTNQYTGYCGSNLPPGSYKVTIVAIDRAGNAARSEASTNLTILDPRDLNPLPSWTQVPIPGTSLSRARKL